MLRLLKLIFGVFDRSFRPRRDLLLENLALRQQLAVLARRRPQPRFSNGDRFLWITLRRFWSGWRKALILVQPDTVVGWHRAGFTLYWPNTDQEDERYNYFVMSSSEFWRGTGFLSQRRIPLHGSD